MQLVGAPPQVVTLGIMHRAAPAYDRFRKAACVRMMAGIKTGLRCSSCFSKHWSQSLESDSEVAAEHWLDAASGCACRTRFCALFTGRELQHYPASSQTDTPPRCAPAMSCASSLQRPILSWRSVSLASHSNAGLLRV